MQKKLIALAVAGLMSSAAFAGSVTVSGRADAGYMFKRTANADTSTGGQNSTLAYKTTEEQVDGNHGTTEIWVKGRDQVNKYIEAGADLNMRYASGLSAGKDGMGKNDRKTLFVKFPFATLQMGTSNLASGEYKLATKPYAGNNGEWEGVKWSISQINESQLTSRNTTVWSDPKALSFGPVALLFKGTFAGGDSRKAGTNDASGKSSGDVKVVGTEFSLFNKLVTGGYDVSNRASTDSILRTGMTWSHAYVSGTPIPKKLKIGAAYNVYKGRNGGNADTADTAFKAKTLSLHANYAITPMFELGATWSRYMDLGTAGAARNSGEGWMVGANYFLSKQTIVYLGVAKQDFEANATGTTVGTTQQYANTKYDGTGTNFSGNVSRVDERSLRLGVRVNF